VPVSFAEISNFRIACEVAYHGAGYMPELSFGSHFFQDLVEADIFYAAIFEDESTVFYNPNFFEKEKNVLNEIIVTEKEIEDIVKVYEVKDAKIALISDVLTGKTVCGRFE
jgi:hypothetical protein